MSLPEIKEIAGGYLFVWNSTENVQIKVTRIRGSNDDVKAYLEVSTTAPGYQPHLTHGNFNFNAIKTRREWAKYLTEQYDIDWEAIFEQLTVYTIERVRRGEPVQEILASDEKIEAPRYILEPFLIENYPNVFFGDPSSFKSSMAIIIMGCVILPWQDNPLRLKVPDRPIRTLLLDWETDLATIKYQVACFQRGMGLPPIPINYRRCSTPLINDLEQIQNAIVDTKSELLVIDSLGLACGGELNEAGPAIQFFTGLRQLKITSLLLAHNAKNRESNHKSIYGSVYFEAQSRSIWQLTKKQEKGSNELDLCLKNTKSPPFRKSYADLGYHISFGEDAMTVKTCDPKSVSEFLETMGTQTRIIELLKDGPLKPTDIATQLELTENNVRVVLSNLKKSNEVIKINDGYGLAYKS
jgi:hypothetical protein